MIEKEETDGGTRNQKREEVKGEKKRKKRRRHRKIKNEKRKSEIERNAEYNNNVNVFSPSKIFLPEF